MVGQSRWPPGRDAVESAAFAWLDAHRQDLVDKTAALLRIESVEAPPEPGRPFGPGVGAALEFVDRLAREFGLETANVDGHAVHAHWGPRAPFVGVLTHVDVVPAGGGWSVPPFGGVVIDGRIYGRGAIDNKGPTVASLFALAALAAAGAPVKRGLRLIVGGDEETGFQCLRHYFKRQPYPEMAFSPDAVFPLVFAEKGILDLTLALPSPGPVMVSLRGGQRPNVVPDEAEARLQLPPGESPAEWQGRLVAAAASKRRAQITLESDAGNPAHFRVKSRGVATHGSTPEKGVNAAAELLACLVEADAGRGLVDPSGTLAFLARAGSGIYGEGLGIAARDDVSGVLTCNLGVLRLEGRELSATFNIRYPVSLACAAALLAKAAEQVREAGGRIVDASDDPPHHVPEDSFIVRTLLEVYRQETGDDTPPLAIGGGTYARLVPGAVAFGPVFPFSGIVPHEKDENIEIEHLRRLARLYAAALWALAR